MNKDILICGVGGQGTVLASKLLAASAMAEGNTVHSAETIGMAQRGGSEKSFLLERRRPCACEYGSSKTHHRIHSRYRI